MTSRCTSLHWYGRPARSHCSMGSVDGSVLGERSYTLRISLLSWSMIISTGSMASGSATSTLAALAGSISMVRSSSDAVTDKNFDFTDISSSFFYRAAVGSGRGCVLTALDQRLQIGHDESQGVQHNPSH